MSERGIISVDDLVRCVRLNDQELRGDLVDEITVVADEEDASVEFVDRLFERFARP